VQTDTFDPHVDMRGNIDTTLTPPGAQLFATLGKLLQRINYHS
jgi:hypothetical protein